MSVPNPIPQPRQRPIFLFNMKRTFIESIFSLSILISTH